MGGRRYLHLEPSDQTINKNGKRINIVYINSSMSAFCSTLNVVNTLRNNYLTTIFVTLLG